MDDAHWIVRQMSECVSGETVRVEVKFRQAQNYPVDLYYIMDLSQSMFDDKESLARLGDTIGTCGSPCAVSMVMLALPVVVLPSGRKFSASRLLC